MTFESMGLDEQLLEAMSYMGFKNATPIQEAAMPKILSGKDLIACAQTGTGKTGAFLLPVLNELTKKNDNYINAVIIVPTRELAIQIDEQIQGLSYFAGIHSIAMYGGGKGGNWSDEKAALNEGCHIVVATPGKLIAHLNMGTANLNSVKHVILDEADRMLDIGFHDDILRILSYMPKKRQTLLFSATMPPKIRQFANAILKKPEEINLSISKPASGVKQQVFLAYNNQKIDLIEKLLLEEERQKYASILIFSSTKKNVFQIVRQLGKIFDSIEGISSDLEQDKREECVTKFKAKETRIVVATDVLSRGIDVKDINLVINYDVPKAAEDYVHRVGRTARANTKGEAITIVNEDDMYGFSKIESLIERTFEKQMPPEELGEGPEWNTKKRARFESRSNDRKGPRGTNPRNSNRRKPNDQRNKDGKKKPTNSKNTSRSKSTKTNKKPQLPANGQPEKLKQTKTPKTQNPQGEEIIRRPKRRPRQKVEAAEELLNKDNQKVTTQNKVADNEKPKRKGPQKRNNNQNRPNQNNGQQNKTNNQRKNNKKQESSNHKNKGKRPYNRKPNQRTKSKEERNSELHFDTPTKTAKPKKSFFKRLFGLK